MVNGLVIVVFTQDYLPSTGAGYAGQEQAAFPRDQAITLVARGIATFANPADLEANREAVEIAKRSRPSIFVRRMVPPDPRRWG